MNKIKNFAKKLWADESGQGTAEYVLLAAIVVALVIMFKDRIRGAMSSQIERVGGQIESFDPSN